MSRLLFIAPDHPSAHGGREQLSRLHRAGLGALLGDRFDAILLPRARLSGASALAAAWSGRVDGTDRAAEQRVLAHVAANDIGQVWLDGSNLGVLAKAIKQRFPNVEVLTFFHNIEPRFYLGLLRRHPSPRALGVLAASFAAERKAARWSDRIVVLNARDGRGVVRLHRRSPTDLLPMAIADGLTAERAPPPTPSARFVLFVGGSFYANRAGIAWFAANVAPSLPVETLVVGSGMEAQRAELEAHRGVKVIGRVDDLAPYYRDALAVIAPIFDGSGMKTKVAEAWMHGKQVIGTDEAFTGYEIATPLAPCNDAAAFSAAIAALAAAPPPPFDPALRALYEKHFSSAALNCGLSRAIAPRDASAYRAAFPATPSPPST